MKNSKIILVSVFMILTAMVSFGQKLTGIVYMVDEPVKGAKISVGSVDGEVIKSDHNGYFSVAVNGMTTMTVSHKKSKTTLNVNELTGFVDVVLMPTEKLLAKMISNTPTIAKCEAYISTYPEGQKIEFVKGKIEELTFIQAFDEAVSDNNLKLLEQYLADFPNGEYTGKAKKTLDVVSWQQAKNVGTQQAYELYIKKFPNGEALSLAKEKLAMINE